MTEVAGQGKPDGEALPRTRSALYNSIRKASLTSFNLALVSFIRHLSSSKNPAGYHALSSAYSDCADLEQMAPTNKTFFFCFGSETSVTCSTESKKKEVDLFFRPDVDSQLSVRLNASFYFLPPRLNEPIGTLPLATSTRCPRDIIRVERNKP